MSDSVKMLSGRTLRLLKGGAALTVIAALVLTIRALPQMLAKVPLFEVATVRVEGAEMVPDREILEWAAIPDTATVWDDPTEWEVAVSGHPVVRAVRIRRDLPSTLVVEVEERIPVAFVATPILEPVDLEGRILPIDPSRVRLDLPIVRLQPSEGSDGPPLAHRLRPQVEAVVRLRENPAFHGRLSELREEADGTATALWGSSPGLEVKLRLPIDPVRLEDGLAILERELSEDATATPLYLDLRWEDQVYVGRGAD